MFTLWPWRLEGYCYSLHPFVYPFVCLSVCLSISAWLWDNSTQGTIFKSFWNLAAIFFRQKNTDKCNNEYCSLINTCTGTMEQNVNLTFFALLKSFLKSEPWNVIQLDLLPETVAPCKWQDLSISNICIFDKFLKCYQIKLCTNQGCWWVLHISNVLLWEFPPLNWSHVPTMHCNWPKI